MEASSLPSPSQVLDLAVLGVASERARSARELLAAVRHIGGGRFQPTAEVGGGRIAALAEAACWCRRRARGRRSAGGRRAPARPTSGARC